jgi:hypothetical protein
MQRGYLPDYARNTVVIASWAPGEPEAGWLFGGIKRAEDAIPLTAYRCSKCGYVEFYART